MTQSKMFIKLIPLLDICERPLFYSAANIVQELEHKTYPSNLLELSIIGDVFSVNTLNETFSVLFTIDF